MKLLYFASLADLVGRQQEEISPQAGWTLADLVRYLEGRFPDLQAVRGSYRVSADLQLVSEGQALDGVTEVALIPPVSGG